MDSRRILIKAVVQLAGLNIVLQVQRAFRQFDILAAFGCKLGQTDLLIHSVDRHLHAGLVLHRDRQAAGVGGLAAFRDFGIFRHQTTTVLTQIDTGLVHDVHGHLHGIGRRVAVGIVHLERKVLGILHSGIRRERERLAFHVHHHLAGLRRQLPLPGLGILGHLLAVQRQITFAVRAEVDAHSAGDLIAFLDGCCVSCRTDRRYVVHHVHRNGRAGAVSVRIRHRHGQIMRDLRVRNGIALDVLRGVASQLVAELQLARGRVIARHGQGAFICGHNVAGQLAVCKNHHVADDDGSHAVRGIDGQGAVGRNGRLGLTSLSTARQAGFVHRHLAAIRADPAGDGHLVVDIDFRGAGLHRIRSKLRAAIETDIQTTQMIDAVQQIAAAVLVIAAAARGTAGGGTGGGHQVFTKGREEILAADLHTFHLERRHLFLGIRGVEILQLDGSAILERQDEVVAAAGQRRGIRRKIKDEAPVRSAGDGLRGTSSRLGKTDIGHEGPPEKKWYLSKNR